MSITKKRKLMYVRQLFHMQFETLIFFTFLMTVIFKIQIYVIHIE